MTKTFTFKTKKANNTSKIYTCPFLNTTTYTEPNYSKIIDDGILANIIKNNSYMFDYTEPKIYTGSPIILNSSYLKDDDDAFIKAANFLANYKTYKKKYINLPYILGKMYKLSDGTPIVFYDDEIQIGFDTYKYTDLSNLSFLNGITDNTKKIIINIYTTGAANININLFK